MTTIPYKILITTSGVGNSLGDSTKYTNKSLIKIGDKPVLSYIVESYSKNTELVITLGHFGQYVKDFLELAYPERKFTFVWVDKYEGRGSNLVYSMLKASPHLQCPFIYHAGDTIVTENIPPPTKNWCGGFKGSGSSKYTSFNTLNNSVQQINNKGTTDPDYLLVGLNGIHTYKSFWKYAKKTYIKNKFDQSLSDITIIDDLIKHHVPFSYHQFSTWLDTGSTEELSTTKRSFPPKYPVLEKPTESIFFVNHHVIKFFSDPKMVINRVKRSHYLKYIVPQIIDHRENFYKYRFVRGRCYAQVATKSNFRKLLKWSKSRLWKPLQEISQQHFQEICRDFYYTKTQKRIAEFLSTRLITDQTCLINGTKIPPVSVLLSRVNWDWLCQANQTTFHGDFILDNIIKTKTGFRLIDWRQDFGGLLKSGDIYYDLAKLNHNLIINHDVITNNHFTIKFKINPKTKTTLVTCDTLRPQRLVECQEYLIDFIKKNGYDSLKINMLTAISWLNMSPLHEHPYDLFLFYFGRYYLFKSLNEYQKQHS